MASVTDEQLTEIEARADMGCDGHNRVGLAPDDLDDLLYCPCTDQTAADVRALLHEVRRLTRENHLLNLSRGIPSVVGGD